MFEKVKLKIYKKLFKIDVSDFFDVWVVGVTVKLLYRKDTEPYV